MIIIFKNEETGHEKNIASYRDGSRLSAHYKMLQIFEQDGYQLKGIYEQKWENGRMNLIDKTNKWMKKLKIKL
jgi:hypothetical protein